MSRVPTVALWMCLFMHAPSFAQTPVTVTRLVWQRADNATTCIDGASLEAAVEDHLHSDVLSTDDEATTVIDGRVARMARGGGYRARVNVSRNGVVIGEREVSVRGACTKLNDALVLVIALALETPDPARAAPSASSTPRANAVPALSTSPLTATDGDDLVVRTMEEPTASTEAAIAPAAPPAAPARQAPKAPQAPTPPRPPNPRTTDSRSRPVASASLPSPGDAVRESRQVPAPSVEPPDRQRARGSLSVGGALASGWMPGPAAGVTLAVSVPVSSRWSAELASVLWPMGEQPTDVGALRFVISYGQARLCPAWLRGGVALDGCVGVNFGAVWADARGFDQGSASSVRGLIGAGLLGRAAWWIHDAWFLRAVVELGMPCWRDRFMVARTDGNRVELHRIAPITAGLGLDLGLGW